MLILESAIGSSSGGSLTSDSNEPVKSLGERVVAVDLNAALQERGEQILLPLCDAHEIRLIAANHAVGLPRALRDRGDAVTHFETPAPNSLDVEPVAAAHALQPRIRAAVLAAALSFLHDRARRVGGHHDLLHVDGPWSESRKPWVGPFDPPRQANVRMTRREFG